MAKRTVAVTFRFDPDELARIDERAETAGYNRTRFIVLCALGELELEPNRLLRQISKLDERLMRCESILFP